MDVNNQIISTITTSYDAVGNITTSGDVNSQYAYSYDAIDRITAVDNQGTPSVPRVLLNYTYDAAGNLTSTTDTINTQLTGTLNYTYDTLNRLTKLTQTGLGVSGKRVDMSYDAGNQMTSLNRYSDVLGANLVASSLYTYDLASRLTSINYQRANNTTINSFSYTYDAANRLTQETSTDGTSNYSYDATNQLTSTDNTNQADEAYSYDANGNRTNGSYGTGTNNQLLTDGKFNYQYDDEGNRTRKVEIATGEVTEYGWDYRNRLISVTVADVNGVVIKSVVYTYDVNNRRIGKVIDVDGVGAATATVERFVYDGNQIGLVFDGAGNQTHRYLYGAGVDQILADETVTGTNWAVTDKLGTVTDVIDNNGLVLNHIVYDSFGKVVTRSDTSFEFRYGFTGREYDGETGLDYYRARYYDSANGRFISEDPIGFGAGDGNLSRYVGNSPVNGTDPSGYREVLPIPKPIPIPFIPPKPVGPTPTLNPFVFGAQIFWEILKPTPVSNGELPPALKPRPTFNQNPKAEVETQSNPNCPDRKTCSDPEFSQYAKYSMISQPSEDIRSGYKFIQNDNDPTSGLNAAFKYIESVRKRKEQESLVNKKKERNALAWWSAEIEYEKEEPGRTSVCSYPPGSDKHYNVVFSNQNIRLTAYGWNSFSVGSIGECQACKDENQGPKIVTVFAALNVKNVGGKERLRPGF